MSPDSVGVGGNTEGPSSDVPRQCGCGGKIRKDLQVMSPDSVGVGGNTEGPSSDVPRQCGCGGKYGRTFK